MTVSAPRLQSADGEFGSEPSCEVGKYDTKDEMVAGKCR